MSTVFRVVKNCNYTTLSNYHFKDRRLSWKAKGLLSTMLSLPENWNYTIEGLSKLADDGIKATNSGLLELEKYGYLIRHQQRNDNGHFGVTEYVIYEQPIENIEETDVNPVSDDIAFSINDCTSQPLCQNGQTVENTAFQPFVQKRQTEKRFAEKGVQLNTNILSTNILNTKEYPSSSMNVENVESNEEEENRLREQMEIGKLAQRFTYELSEAVFEEICKRNSEFRQLINYDILEKVCESIMNKQRKEPIRMLPNLINTYLDNIMLGIRACGDKGKSPPCQQHNKFNDFQQNEYDFVELEKELMNN